MRSRLPFGFFILLAAFLPACNAEVVVNGTGGQDGACFYACDTNLTTSVTCGSDNLWHSDTPPCPPSIVCGNTVCKAGEVCVKKAGGPGYSYQCAPDPCAPDALSCACAEVLCGGSPFVCTGASGMELLCDCPVCQ